MCNAPAGLSSTCAPGSTMAGGVLTGSLGTMSMTPGATYTVITQGPWAGQVFQVNGATVANVTSTVTITTMTAPTSTANGVYRIDTTTFNGITNAVIADTAAPSAAPTAAPSAAPTAAPTGAPTSPASASSSSDSGGVGGSLLIIVVVILVVVLIAVVLVVVIKKKKDSEGDAARNAGAVSFENPMVRLIAPPGCAYRWVGVDVVPSCLQSIYRVHPFTFSPRHTCSTMTRAGPRLDSMTPEVIIPSRHMLQTARRLTVGATWTYATLPPPPPPLPHTLIPL
jgi:hypothetical protein